MKTYHRKNYQTCISYTSKLNSEYHNLPLDNTSKVATTSQKIMLFEHPSQAKKVNIFSSKYLNKKFQVFG